MRRQVRAAGRRLAHREHVIVVVTHAALLGSDLSTYGGWSLLIDEVPQVWPHLSMRTPASAAQLRACYNLLPTEREGWSRVQPKASAPGAGAYRRDDYLQDLATFHERAKAGHRVARLTSWDDAFTEAGWDCYALWSGRSLAHFSPRIAGVNDLAHYSTATFVYSGKASPQEQAALSTLGVSRDDLIRSREGEDILQIALRGSLRVPEDDRTFLFRVYDRTQAETLAEQIDALGLPITVSLRYRDIDIDAIGRPKPEPKIKCATPGEKCAATREQSRERMRRMRAQRRCRLGDAA